MRDGLGDWYMPSANTTHAFKSRTLYGHFKEAYVHRQKGSNRATKGSDEGASSSENDEDDTYFNITLTAIFTCQSVLEPNNTHNTSPTI
ncbi:hypothetical protein T4B_1364 [Trichinella pseudospiralis]|uniref:Uncharacterized protein n=1 Tax=Trichinella pseudospiralis TaxID=6337 RepID=A0A0V1GQN3_TRIPS|nr:hypothetical protein T4B_1364 [Trichinella pseudospiralis]